jgi:hypothetical protein
MIAKDFNKKGSLVYQFDSYKEEVDQVKVSKIVDDTIQIVNLYGDKALEVYSEYSPYTYATSWEEFVEKVKEM